ncbi:MAG: UDP-N-acetylmuramate-alanine ligase, partial [Pseudomonadota bacterium]
SNARAADSNIMAFEADESDGSFCLSNPYCAIITNAEPEHMEYYNYDLENFHNHYKHFLQIATKRVFNAEDEFLSTLDIEAVRLYPSKDITNIKFELKNDEPTTTFTLKDLGEFSVWGFGGHIALDASLAILAAMNEKGLDEIRENLGKFKGLKKRFDILAKHSTYALIDDYAHHPTEIEATMQSVKLYANLAKLEGITAIWQPHKWSRLCDNLEHFSKCFDGVTRLIILPVWAVNEEPRDVNFKDVFKAYAPIMATHLHKDGDDVVMFLEDGTTLHLNQGVVIGFGAGDITYQLRGEIRK